MRNSRLTMMSVTHNGTPILRPVARKCNEHAGYKEFVGDGVEVKAEPRLHAHAPGYEPVETVGDPRYHEEEAGNEREALLLCRYEVDDSRNEDYSYEAESIRKGPDRSFFIPALHWESFSLP